MQLTHILAILPLISALPHLSDTYHPFFPLGSLLPRVETDSEGRLILNYNSQTEPETVKNKLASNGLSDILDALPTSEKQYRGDARKYMKTHPKPGPGFWLDHADPSSTRQGKDKSLSNTNPLAWVPRKEQLQEAKDVGAAVRQARKDHKQIRTKIDGKDPSEVRRERSQTRPATGPAATTGVAAVGTARKEKAKATAPPVASGKGAAPAKKARKGKRSAVIVIEGLLARRAVLDALVSHGLLI